MKDFNKLAKKLKVSFRDISLLEQAMTHRSYLNENRKSKKEHNERLEFLGDAVLELVVTEHLYQNYPNPEGELTNWRSSLVNGEMLAKVAETLQIEKFLMMSKGEARDKGRARRCLLANAIEAIIGAIYLDKNNGYKKAKEFISQNIIVNLEEVLANKLYLDPKSYFQEKSQGEIGVTPNYRVVKESGPDHDRRYVVAVYIGDDMIAKGEGASKQEAQREAAKKGLEVKKWV